MTTAERGAPDTQSKVNRFFAEPLRDYVLQSLGHPVSLLQAGCLAPLRELGIAELAEGGFEISVSVVDDDNAVARRALREAHSAYDDVITGDLRSAPIPQRTYDVVYCALLLERVHHVELVLDRLVSALKPGGLLLLCPARSGRSTRRRSATRASRPTRCCAASSSPPAAPSGPDPISRPGYHRRCESSAPPSPGSPEGA
jgi:SAM-dependent methyltransferase